MNAILRLSVSIAIGATSGCVYPSKQTYFEVTSTDGRVQPSGCTYPSARRDSIYRSLGSAELYVTTFFKETEHLGVALQVSSKEHDVEIDGKQIQLRLEHGQAPIAPDGITPSSYDSGNQNDDLPIKSWLHLSYPLQANAATTFTLLFGPSALVIKRENVHVEPITFEKVTKTGMYLFTINC